MNETITSSRLRPRELFTPEQIAQLTARSDLRGAWMVLSTWAAIGVCFTALAIWPSIWTFIAAVFVLGGRQHALAILAHEAAHRLLFRTPTLNEWIGDWLCARPIWNDVPRYRTHHLRHHTHTGLEVDPDLSLVTPFPTTRGSLIKKALRDVSGQTALRRIAAQLLMDIGVFEYTVAATVTRRPRGTRPLSDYVREGLRHMTPMLVTNAALFGVLYALGIGWTYWAWIAAYMTTFSLYIRIRSIAEHACMERSADVLRNTRTTRAGWLARLTVAPMHVNYHQEHHLMASVPCHRLPELHRMLRANGVVEAPSGYGTVLRMAAARR
ncbi:fatty acid desaturase family protein [Sinimarinibacterium thermocellulolyticum]|uniref:Fatty acid desaturase family protein n=1 Tax=Sinimarinibacterium thermocellulolyticum TaxID=3170016 RepID=A0ABV2ABV4_9GAMM